MDDVFFCFICLGVNKFFIVVVFWGIVGLKKMWGIGG